MDEDEEGNYQDSGNMTCKLTGTYIGPLDIDVYVSDGFGHSENSHDENVEHIDSLGQPFVFHTLADITNVSKNSGSVNGGQYLTISGSGFDANPGSTKIIIGKNILSSLLTTLGKYMTCVNTKLLKAFGDF